MWETFLHNSTFVVVIIQIYIGTSRNSVHLNQDITKELRPGMLVAVQEGSFPKIGRVVSILANPSLESSVIVKWLSQERAPHKPKWLRYFKETNEEGAITVSTIVIYDFDLTRMGAMKKKSREYLLHLFS